MRWLKWVWLTCSTASIAIPRGRIVTAADWTTSAVLIAERSYRIRCEGCASSAKKSNWRIEAGKLGKN